MKKRIIITTLFFAGLLLTVAYSRGLSASGPEMPTVEPLQNDYFEVADQRFQIRYLFTYQNIVLGYGNAGHFVSLSDSVLISKGEEGIGYHSIEKNFLIVKKKYGYFAGITESQDGNIIMIVGIGLGNDYAVYKITGPFQELAQVSDYSLH
ncbi:MAG TPA: hypothetical protein PK360_15730 [bacterium]|mgnify:CR=1 FL=1|nr:hypothetical protein [bacterium]